MNKKAGIGKTILIILGVLVVLIIIGSFFRSGDNNVNVDNDIAIDEEDNIVIEEDEVDTGEFILGPGNFDLRITHNSLERKYLLDVPRSYNNEEEIPLIISLHGGFGDAESSRLQNALHEMGEEENFIVAYPEAVVGPKDSLGNTYQHWNAGPREDPNKGPQHIDDVGFISAMIDEISSNYHIDSKRIYATGLSNGGIMTYRLACQLSDKIAAVAPVSGTLLDIECDTKRSVSIIHFHGRNDEAVPLEGGQVGATKDTWPSVYNIHEDWANNLNCDLDLEMTYSNGEAECNTYSQCNGGTEVTLCVIEDGGHTWPGGNYGARVCHTNPDGLTCSLLKAAIGKISRDISANEEMWKFFQKHPLE